MRLLQSKVVQRRKPISRAAKERSRWNDSGAFRKAPFLIGVGESSRCHRQAHCRLYLHRITSTVISWAYFWQNRSTLNLWWWSHLHGTHWVFWHLSSWWSSVLCICWADSSLATCQPIASPAMPDPLWERATWAVFLSHLWILKPSLACFFILKCKKILKPSLI